jgi:hypothetical protein
MTSNHAHKHVRIDHQNRTITLCCTDGDASKRPTVTSDVQRPNHEDSYFDAPTENTLKKWMKHSGGELAKELGLSQGE